MEKWKPIVGYEGLYEVSNMGKIKALAKSVYKVPGRNQTYPEHIMKLSVSGKYLMVNLHNHKIVKSFMVHRLVGLHHVPNKENYPLLTFKDGNPLNIRASNLEWTTQSKIEIRKKLKNAISGDIKCKNCMEYRCFF